MRQALLALMAIGLAMSLAGAGVMAYFSDTETSSGNTLQAGTLDLKIRDQDEPWGDGVTATWTASDMKPGDSYAFDVPFVGLKNVGSIAGNHLEITCGYEVDETTNPVESDTDPDTDLYPEEMAKQMVIIGMVYYNDAWKFNCLTGEKIDGGDVSVVDGAWTVVDGSVVATDDKWKVEDKDLDEKVTLYDLSLDPLDDLTPPNGETHFVMSLKFSEDATNDFQGDTFVLTMIFTLNQDSSQ